MRLPGDSGPPSEVLPPPVLPPVPSEPNTPPPPVEEPIPTVPDSDAPVLHDATTPNVEADLTDGTYPPGGADLLALLGQVSADAVCRFPDRKGTWSRRIAGATWTPGFFPGDARVAHTIALTFDDGPDIRHTAALLDLLRDYDVRGTFFVVGQQITAKTFPLVQRILNEGHALGNHSLRHDIRQSDYGDERWGDTYLIAEYRFAQMRADIAVLAKDEADFRRMDARVFAGLGGNVAKEQSARAWPAAELRYASLLHERGYAPTDPPARIVWARPPGGNPWFGEDTTVSVDRRAALAEAMRVTGMAVVLWDIDTRDWWYVAHRPEDERAEPVAKAVLDHAAKGGVVLFHDRVPLDGLRMVFDHARTDAGSALRFVTLNELAPLVLGCSIEDVQREITLQRLEGVIGQTADVLR